MATVDQAPREAAGKASRVLCTPVTVVVLLTAMGVLCMWHDAFAQVWPLPRNTHNSRSFGAPGSSGV